MGDGVVVERLQMTRQNSPNLVQNKKSCKNPTSPNKADTGDLSRFVSAKTAMEYHAGSIAVDD